MDTLVAATVAATVFIALASLQYTTLAHYVVFSSYQAEILRALRYSDFLLYSPDGLAVSMNGLVLDHVVDCTRVLSAYAYLKSAGFSGSISCGGIHAGSGGSVVIRRYAVWKGAPVTVEVRMNVSNG